jgi:hypothetical protein
MRSATPGMMAMLLVAFGVAGYAMVSLTIDEDAVDGIDVHSAWMGGCLE